MITYGFVPSYSDAVTVGAPFIINGLTCVAAYIYVSGNSGDIVWENAQGNAQWLPGALTGQTYIIGAQKILASATVNGSSRTTTATGLVWMAIGALNNTP